MAPKEQNPFSKFRMASDSLTNIETEKLITHVPVGKPNKQKFVRVHPDQAFWFECAILKLEDEQRPFLVTPEIASLIVQDIKLVVLRLTIDRQGNLSLWPIPPVPKEGEENTWNHSQRLAASLAEQTWIRLTSNRATGSYEPLKAKGEIPEPVWPDKTLEEILEIAFGDAHIIEERNHPALQRLWGLE